MSFSSEILADSPLWWARHGELSGTTLVDSSGNSRDGTYSGGPLFGQRSLLVSQSGVNSSVNFDGVDDHGVVAHGAWMDVTALTIEAWVRTISTNGQAILMRDDGGTTRPWYWGLTGAGEPKFTVFDSHSEGGSVGDVAAGRAVNDGCPHHLAVSYSNADNVGRAYVDGALTATVTTGVVFDQTSIRIGSDPLTVGFNDLGGGASRLEFDGFLDELVWFGARLSDARIAAHYAAGPRVPCPPKWSVNRVRW